MDYMDYELEDDAPRFLFSSRFGMAVLGFIGFFTMSSQKMSLQIALVCMLNDTATSLLSQDMPRMSHDVVLVDNVTAVLPVAAGPVGVGPDHQEGCGVAAEVFKSYANLSWIDDVSEKGTLVWDQHKRSVIFRTYHVGYLLSQIPAGLMAQRFGGKKVLGACLLTASVSTLLIPFGVRYHYFLLVFLRFMGGAGAGAAFPAMHCFLGRWAPPLERSKLASISYAGALTGVLVTYPITTSLCQFGYDGGWPLIFYVVGGAGVLWFGLWVSSASDSPLQHKRISKEEKEYLVAVLSNQTDLKPTPHFHIPCGAVVSSLPFLAIVISNFVFDWGLYIFEHVIPLYLTDVLDMDLRQVTLFSMMPYVSLWICVIMSGIWSDQLRARGVIGTTVTRKIFMLIGSIIPAAMTVGLGFLNCTQWQGAVAMVILGFSFLGFQYNGFLVNHLDIAPRYAGILMAFSNTCGSVTPFLAPYMVSVMVTEGTSEQWQTVFLSTGCMYGFGVLIYLVCGSGDIQRWAGVTRAPPDFCLGTAALADGGTKRGTKLCNSVSLGDADLPHIKAGKQVLTPGGRPQYQPLTSQQSLPPSLTSPQTSLSKGVGSVSPRGQQGSLSGRPGLAGGRPEVSPYATMPRSPRDCERPRKMPEIDGYPTLRRPPDMERYQQSFNKYANVADTNSRQFLIPPSGQERKSSKSSSGSRGNRSSRNSADMSSKRASRLSSSSPDQASAYNELSESVV